MTPTLLLKALHDLQLTAIKRDDWALARTPLTLLGLSTINPGIHAELAGFAREKALPEALVGTANPLKVR